MPEVTGPICREDPDALASVCEAPAEETPENHYDEAEGICSLAPLPDPSPKTAYAKKETHETPKSDATQGLQKAATLFKEEATTGEESKSEAKATLPTNVAAVVEKSAKTLVEEQREERRTVAASELPQIKSAAIFIGGRFIDDGEMPTTTGDKPKPEEIKDPKPVAFVANQTLLLPGVPIIELKGVEGCRVDLQKIIEAAREGFGISVPLSAFSLDNFLLGIPFALVKADGDNNHEEITRGEDREVNSEIASQDPSTLSVASLEIIPSSSMDVPAPLRTDVAGILSYLMQSFANEWDFKNPLVGVLSAVWGLARSNFAAPAGVLKSLESDGIVAASKSPPSQDERQGQGGKEGQNSNSGEQDHQETA